MEQSVEHGRREAKFCTTELRAVGGTQIMQNVPFLRRPLGVVLCIGHHEVFPEIFSRMEDVAEVRFNNLSKENTTEGCVEWHLNLGPSASLETKQHRQMGFFRRVLYVYFWFNERLFDRFFVRFF